ncbi:MAG: hypothetical protein QGG54_09410 [Gammaproteobacteria bacterium]|nr:hypothetical protein [Gammaproteobacteria bacterium]
MIEGIFRVLKPGGRVAISDIVSDEIVPQHLRDNDELWTGCISGAFQEQQFAQAFLDAGFVLVNYDKWDQQPWQVVEGIEFRVITLMALKPSPQQHLDIGQAVIYKGPYSEVHDDEGHVYPRGIRIAVSDRSFELLTEGPLKDDFIGISPAAPIRQLNSVHRRELLGLQARLRDLNMDPVLEAVVVEAKGDWLTHDTAGCL